MMTIRVSHRRVEQRGLLTGMRPSSRMIVGPELHPGGGLFLTPAGLATVRVMADDLSAGFEQASRLDAV